MVGVLALSLLLLSDFLNATVSYELESPTVALDYVYFPSVTLCSMNNLRKSFIYSLMEDPVLGNLTTATKLTNIIERRLIKGIVDENSASNEEDKIVQGK